MVLFEEEWECADGVCFLSTDFDNKTFYTIIKDIP